MSNEIVKQNYQPPTTFNFFDAEQFAVMQRVSTMFANSELVPDIYKMSDTNPKDKAIANCMIAIETAQRIGASPLLVMQNLNIIYGRPSWSSKFLIATVNGCGRYESMQYKIRSLGSAKGTKYIEYVWENVNGRNKKMPKHRVFEQDVENFECIAYTSVKGSKDVLESTPVTIQMAIEEGWYTKDGSKWKTMPLKMLKYRAASFWTNEYAPELSMGIKTVEEHEDIEDIDHEEVASKLKPDFNGRANRQEMSMDDDAPKGSDESEAGGTEGSTNETEGNNAPEQEGEKCPI